jgi:uncharacterized protein with von Willebrand factor type A (vWA) domain
VLLEALDKQVIEQTPEAFYYLSRATFVKDEGLLDRFDQVFNRVFKGFCRLWPEPRRGSRGLAQGDCGKVPDRRGNGRDQVAGIVGRDHGDAQKRLEEQEGRHQGGNKWIGTGGPAPSAIRATIPKVCASAGKAVTSARSRFGKSASSRISTTRANWAPATSRSPAPPAPLCSRRAADELDLDATIEGTARQGWLDIRMRPERHNAVKLLLFLDVGGSMDPFIKLVEELFSAATAEFKNLEFFYFHNCLYEGVWKDNRRRWSERTQTWDILHKYGHDYKVIFVGDAAMSPTKSAIPADRSNISTKKPGGVDEPRGPDLSGDRLAQSRSRKAVGYSQSTRMIRDLVGGSMHPLTLQGLDNAMRELTRKKG